MPFTMAHVVLARPLWRAVGRQLPLSGIVVGSVAPDLEYLAHLDTKRTIGDLLHGVFLLDLLLALVLLALWLVSGVSSLSPNGYSTYVRRLSFMS